MMLAKYMIPCDFASYFHASDVNVATNRDEHVTGKKKWVTKLTMIVNKPTHNIRSPNSKKKLLQPSHVVKSLKK